MQEWNACMAIGNRRLLSIGDRYSNEDMVYSIMKYGSNVCHTDKQSPMSMVAESELTAGGLEQ